MASGADAEDAMASCRLIERLVDESAVLILVLPGGREVELDRRRPGSRIEEDGIGVIARLIEREVKSPTLQQPSSEELGVFGFEAWKGIHQRLHRPGNDPDSLTPEY